MLFSTRAFIAASLVLGSSGVNAAPGSGSAVLGAPVKITGSVVYNVSAEHSHLFDFQHKNLAKKSCASDYNTAALNTAAAMQSLYYNSGGWYQGGSGGGSAWTDVNAAEDLMNMELANSATTYDGVPEAIFNHYDAQFTNGGAYDDLLWAVLASLKQCDYLSWRGQSTAECTNRAIKYYNIVVGAWDGSTCGGGVWWSSARTYKNAITNELFLYSSGAAYLRTGQAAFLNNANLAWSWLSGSGGVMRNSAGLYNDGLTSSCANNGQTTWTYNQIVIASGLSALYAATGSSNSALLTQAQISIDATIADMETNNILRESCDNANGATTCDADQQIFKGIFMKHLQFFLDTANQASLRSKYAGFINAQASGVVHYATGSGFNVGSVWYAPDAGGSIHSPKTQTSGLAALVAAAKYTTC